MRDMQTTEWPQDEEAAFTLAMGQWVQAWFQSVQTSGKEVLISPNTQAHLALVWRAGRMYERDCKPKDGGCDA